MRKTFLMMAAMMVSVLMQAAECQDGPYGLYVNGVSVYTFEDAGMSPDQLPQLHAVAALKKGDKVEFCNTSCDAKWFPQNIETGGDVDGSGNFTITSGVVATCNVAGCYNFWWKKLANDDRVYIGTDGDCSGGGGGGSSSSAAPAQCPDVILQAFYWDSYDGNKSTTKYGRTRWIDHINGTNGSSAVEMGQWFDMIWLPQLSKSTGGMGYLPTNYSNLDSDLGTQRRLGELISIFHQNGARVMADIVINHAVAGQGWCGYNQTYNFGEYGSFKPDGSYICNTDEMNYDSKAGSCKGYATGAADDGYGDEANYPDGRDWDHTSTKVRDMFKAYLKWLHNVVKIDGFRYDYCKGYHNSHINEYNRAAEAYFSVMEYWDGNVNTLQSRLADAGWNTTTFDFATKYTAFNNGIASDYYQGLKGAGLPGAGKSRYAVTFVDSHDSFQRDNNELCGEGNSMSLCRDKVLQCNAYMLSMPGVPCVFWPHWVTFKDEIKAMINARYKAGVHSESAVSDETGNGFYKATITGTNGSIRLLLGPNSGYDTTPQGYVLAVKGVNYGVYYKMNSARGDKNTERKPIPEGVEEITSSNSSKGEKMLRDGQLLIKVGEQVFDARGMRVK